MEIAALLLVPIGIFVTFAVGRWFLDFCSGHEEAWWGGFPLWMTGCLCVLAPLFFASLLGPFALLRWLA